MTGEEVAFIQEPRKTGSEGKERLVKGWLQERGEGSRGAREGTERKTKI